MSDQEKTLVRMSARVLETALSVWAMNPNKPGRVEEVMNIVRETAQELRKITGQNY